MLCASLPAFLRSAAAQQKISEARRGQIGLCQQKADRGEAVAGRPCLDLVMGPYTAALLADFGADVVSGKAWRGDPSRAARRPLQPPVQAL
jgi:hypothetical protein